MDSILFPSQMYPRKTLKQNLNLGRVGFFTRLYYLNPGGEDGLLVQDGGGAGHVVVLAQPAQPGFEAAGARLALLAGRAGRAGARAAGRPLQLLPGPVLVVWVLLQQAANSTVQRSSAAAAALQYYEGG